MGQDRQISVVILCPLLGVTRQSFYGFFRAQTKEAFQADLVLVEVARLRVLLPQLGTRKLLYKMQDFLKHHDFRLGRDAFFEVLRAEGCWFVVGLAASQKPLYRTTGSRNIQI